MTRSVGCGGMLGSGKDDLTVRFGSCFLLLRGKGSDSQGPGLFSKQGVDICLAYAHSPFIAAREKHTMTKSMTQAEIETAKQAAVKSHGAVVDSYGFFDSIVYRHADGARATLTYDERPEVRGWVYKAP